MAENIGFRTGKNFDFGGFLTIIVLYFLQLRRGLFLSGLTSGKGSFVWICGLSIRNRDRQRHCQNMGCFNSVDFHR